MNNGTIDGVTGPGIVAFASTTSIQGGITNSGTITGSRGISLDGTDAGAFVDSIENQSNGSIIGTSGAALRFLNTTITSGVTNAGTMTGVSEGMSLETGTSVSGGVLNSGSISATSGPGMFIGFGASVTGDFTNTGMLSGASGFQMDDLASIDAVTNTGSISASGNAIHLTFDVSITGVLTNTGTIEGNGGIFVGTNSFIGGGILNSGTIRGTGGTAIRYDGVSAVSPITLDGGRVIGDIVDLLPAMGRSPVTVSGSFATEGDIDVSSLTVSSGKGLTISSGNTVTLNSMPASSGGRFTFGLDDNSGTGRGQLNVSGAGQGMNLSGATLAVAYTGGIIAAGDELRIGQGNAAITGGPGGTMAAVTDSSYLWNFHVADGTAASSPTDNTELFLFVSRNEEASFSTPGNAAAADALLGLSGTADSQLQPIITSLNSAATEQAANQIAESVQATIDGSTFLSAQTFANRMFDLAQARLASLGVSSNRSFTSNLSASDLNWLVGKQDQSSHLNALTPAGGSGSAGLNVGRGPMNVQGHSAWAQVFGQSISQGSREGFADYRSNTSGLAFGMDTADLFSDSVLGAAFSYGDTNITSRNANATRTAIGSYQVSLYGSHALSNEVYIRGMTTFGRNATDYRRQDVGGVTGLTARGQYDAEQYAAQAEIGKDIAIGDGVVSPHAVVSYMFYDPDNYTETDAGGASLRVKQKAIHNLEVGVGVSASKEYSLDDGSKVTPEVRTGVRMNLVRDRLEATSSFTGGGASFASQGPTLPLLSASVGTGLTYAVSDDWNVQVNYDFEAKEDFSAHAGFVRSTFRF